MKRLLVLVSVVATIALSVLASSAAAANNTGWPCPIPHQVIRESATTALQCRPATMTWWRLTAPF